MRGVRVTQAAVVLLTTFALWACGADAGGGLCTPGTSIGCVCSDGDQGAQSCNGEGTGYDPCECSAGSEPDASTDADAGQEVDAAVGPSPTPVGEWIAVEPGGDTICARGTPFRFYVYGGDPTRVVLDFLGGGACWNTFSCQVGQMIEGQPIFQDSAGTLEGLQAEFDAGALNGIYDLDNPDNPYRGWTVIRVPYCSGDFYWGDAVVDYTDDLKIHHRGFKNATSVTAWVEETYPDAQRIVSTGCEAGAYGSLNQALTLNELFPDAVVTALGDSGAGVITQSFFAEAFMIWNAFASMPLHLSGLAGKALEDITVTDFVVAASLGHPDLRVAQYLTAHDVVQSFHYMFMGGELSLWHDQAVASLEHIRARADNFRYYLAPGPIHCINPYDITYEREVNGVAYTDWLEALISDETLPDDVFCGVIGGTEEEDTCRNDAICDGCLDGTIESDACGNCQSWEP